MDRIRIGDRQHRCAHAGDRSELAVTSDPRKKLSGKTPALAVWRKAPIRLPAVAATMLCRSKRPCAATRMKTEMGTSKRRTQAFSRVLSVVCCVLLSLRAQPRRRRCFSEAFPGSVPNLLERTRLDLPDALR
jgi:hypothetical protein